MVCLSPVATNIPYPTGDKHTISTLLIKPIFSVLAHAEKQFFSKLVFEYFKWALTLEINIEGELIKEAVHGCSLHMNIYYAYNALSSIECPRE